jgi:hypothetical protein
VEPANVPLEGICVACVLTRPSVEIHKNQPAGKSALSTSCTQLNIHSPNVPHDLKVTKQLDGTPEFRYPPDSLTLMIANFSDEELTLPKETILGVAQEISENLVVSAMRKTLIEVQNRHFILEAIKRHLRGLRNI